MQGVMATNFDRRIFEVLVYWSGFRPHCMYPSFEKHAA